MISLLAPESLNHTFHTQKHRGNSLLYWVTIIENVRRANVADGLWLPDSSGKVHVQSKPLTQELSCVDIVVWFPWLGTEILYDPCSPGIGKDPPSSTLPYRSLPSHYVILTSACETELQLVHSTFTVWDLFHNEL